MKTTHLEFSETGRRRSNQDTFRSLSAPNAGKSLFVICDGMGGHSFGDVASRTVCEAICTYWSEHLDEPDTKRKYSAACKAASEAIDRTSDKFNRSEMGTTLVMVAIDSDMLTITHCGDSRCYLLRDDSVIYQTKDHINPGYGLDIVSRCFFSYNHEVAKPEIEQFNIENGDRIFLCSDGVYKATAPEILTARLMDDKPLEDITDTIEFLCEKYSDDNYTGILIQID